MKARLTALLFMVLATGWAHASVIGIEFYAEASGDLGDPGNTVFNIDLNEVLGTAPGGEVVIDGIGWDVLIGTYGSSWLSDTSVSFNDEIYLTPGLGYDVGGLGAFTSGGIFDLSDAALPDIVLGDGILTLEFYDIFDDVVGGVDAFWSGFLYVSAQAAQVPEPGVLALLATGFVGLAFLRRRKPASESVG